MAYEKQTWATGDTITAQKLNHMEDGIAGAGGSGNLILSGEAAPENTAVKDTQNDVTINRTLILMSDAEIGEFVFTSNEDDGVVYYSPVLSVSLVNVSPITDEQTAAYTISEPMDAIQVISADGTGKVILPTSTEWVPVISAT